MMTYQRQDVDGLLSLYHHLVPLLYWRLHGSALNELVRILSQQKNCSTLAMLVHSRILSTKVFSVTVAPIRATH